MLNQLFGALPTESDLLTHQDAYSDEPAGAMSGQSAAALGQSAGALSDPFIQSCPDGVFHRIKVREMGDSDHSTIAPAYVGIA